MFRKIPFSKEETKVVGSIRQYNGTMHPQFNAPVSYRTNFEALWPDRHPYFMPHTRDIYFFDGDVYNYNIGRTSRETTVDVFGITWTFEPTSGGSIAIGGNPILEDVNDWKNVIKIPNPDEWDWEGCAEKAKFDMASPAFLTMNNGFWFERLISFMDFMGAAMALIDEEQTDAIKELFAAMTDLGCKVVDKLCQYFPALDAIEVHDDWGSQQAPFFSQDVAEELFVPFMKQITDRIHANGRIAMLHSCGHVEDRIQCFIDGGFDLWCPQNMNNIEELYDKYGDKIILGVFPVDKDIAKMSEEDQRAAARRFVDRFNQPGKPSIMGLACGRMTTDIFLEEVYSYSRQRFAEWE